jgi:hypothetical protein
MGERRAGEAVFAGRWAAGEWCGWVLRTEQGEDFTLVFQGRRGGGAGPDFRDTILERRDGTRIRGDVELHLRPGGWYAHAHAADPRYNDAVLHVTPRGGRRVAASVPLASGGTAPQAALERVQPPASVPSMPRWPCARLSERIGPAAVRVLLREAGAARFARRVAAFEGELAGAGCSPSMERARRIAAGRVLAVALAEALGYGRDRALPRHAGARLSRGDPPAALLEAAIHWPRVERTRLEGLIRLWERWGGRGPGRCSTRSPVRCRRGRVPPG